MMETTLPRITPFSALERWDVKYFEGRIKSKYPKAPLATFVTEHSEKVRPYDFPEKTFKILGVNNSDGIFHAYDSLGKEINQPYKKVRAGDFAYNPYRINVGSIGCVPSEHDGAYISPAYVVFSVDKHVILPELLWFILKSDFFNKSLRAATAGSVRMNLTYPLLETLQVPVPPLPIQQKIVTYWERENIKAKYDKSKAQDIADSIPVFLAEQLGLPPMKRVHSKKAFLASWKDTDRWGVKRSRELSCQPDMEKGIYPVVSLSEVMADLQNGWSPKCLARSAKTEEWGVLKLGAISYGKFDDNANKTLPSKFTPREELEVKVGDILINRGNVLSLVGAVTHVTKTRNHLMIPDLVFRVVDLYYSLIDPDYLVSVLRMPVLRREIESIATGSSPTMKKITKPALLALRIPLPPIEVQKTIVDILLEKHAGIASLFKQVEENTKKTEKQIEHMILGTLSVEDL